MLLYPRLPPSVAREIATEISLLGVSELAERSDLDHPTKIFAPIGGIRARSEHLAEIQSVVRDVALRNGYPVSPSRTLARQFDAMASESLHRTLKVCPSEAAHNGMWSFLACVVLPDVVRWRFQGGAAGTTVERFLGRVRNALGRLWWRAFILYEEGSRPYELVYKLNEDELVQLMERPSLFGNRLLTIMTARIFLDLIDTTDSSLSRMLLMREIQKRIMRLFPLVAFDNISHIAIRNLVLDVSVEAAHIVSKKSRAESG